MTSMSFAALQKLKNGTRDNVGDSDSSSVGTGSELADRDHDLDDASLGPGLTHFTPADLEKAAAASSKHGKKTKGRVKIKMEFIDNKLRRYTTFSKRKTGIMKKAYELSTLTGTQVMLLVASETGHVYTFATRKLQPMITSESGKALIQTCLNSPDIPSDSQHHNPDQRMCATGFEETELSYQVSDEEPLNAKDAKQPLFTMTNVPGAGADANINTSSSPGMGHTLPMTRYLPASSTAQVPAGTKLNTSLAGGLPMTVPQGATYATLISPTGQALTAGQALQTAGVLQVQQGHSQLQLQANAQGQTGAATPTLYRLPQGASLAGAASQMVTALVPSMPVVSTPTTSQQAQNANTVAMLTAPQSALNAAGTPLMYHTPQGVVYAASPAGTVNTLPEGFVFNYQTAATHLHQASQANIEGSSTTAVTGAVTSYPIQLVACQQPQETSTTLVNSLKVPATATMPVIGATMATKRPVSVGKGGGGSRTTATPPKMPALGIKPS